MTPAAGPPSDVSLARTVPCSTRNVASASQYAAVTNAIRSRSRATRKLSATLCTRPADVPCPSFRHSTGDSE